MCHTTISIAALCLLIPLCGCSLVSAPNSSVPVAKEEIPVESPTESRRFVGKCVGVTDGDTISVMRNGKAERVELYGVDCPESGQAYGVQAKEFTSSLVSGAEVTVELCGADSDGLSTGKICLPSGKNLSVELVAAGLAWWCQERAPEDQVLKNFQRHAIANKVGLWADPQALAPWNFRCGISRVPDLSSPPRDQPGSDVVYVNERGSKFHTHDCPAIAQSQDAWSMPRQEALARGYTPCRLCLSTSQQRAPQRTVYITETGTKYHSLGCSHLRRSCIPISLEEAERKGYEPCSRCSPPSTHGKKASTVSLPPHTMASDTPLGPQNRRRIEIHVNDANLSKEDCRTLIGAYRNQAGSRGQVSVRKPDKHGRLQPWGVDNMDGEGVFFNDNLFR